MASFQPGMLLDGRFEVVRAIASGGMGSVYEVSDRKLGGKSFALKEMLSFGGADDVQSARLRFISEVQTMMDLQHPHIPRVTASFIHGKSFCFVMELVPGTDLSVVLKQRGRPGLDAGEVVGWAIQALDALQYCHGLNPPIVHRDVKPANLLLRPDGRVMLLDFGIARVTEPGGDQWIGTPGYAAPEQQDGQAEPRSDLYALGATVHELLTGIAPSDFEFAAFADLGITVEPDLEKIIACTLATYPEDRLSGAAEMSERLRALGCYSGSSFGGNEAYDFEAAVTVYKATILDPLLQKLIKTYRNECQTAFLPKNLDYLQLVLAYPTEFELQVAKDEQSRRVRFSEKQGILEARLLGEVDPFDGEAARQTAALVESFVSDYESFKMGG